MKKIFFRFSHKIMATIVASSLIVILITSSIAFFFVFPILRKEAIKTANSNIKLIGQQTEAKAELIRAYATNIADSFNLKAALRQYGQNSESYLIKKIIINELDNKKSEMGSVIGIAVQPYGGEVITTSERLSKDEQDLFSTGEYKYFSSLDYAKRFFNVYEISASSDHAWDNRPEKSYAATFCMNFYVDEIRYTMTVFVEINDIIMATESLTKDVMDSYIWLDSLRSPFVSSGQLTINKVVFNELQDRLIFNFDIIELDDGYLFMHTVNGSKWILGAYMSDQTLLKTYGGTFLYLLILFIALTILATIISLPLVNIYTNPIRQLTKSMRKVAKGDLSVFSNIKTKDELGELGIGFDNMIKELKLHIDKLIEKEKNEQRMKYSLLISEIDPHFIYNTMNTINYMARKGKTDAIIEVNTALIRILQDRLRINDIEVFDSVSQEIDMVKQYMLIHKYRYQNDVTVFWEVDESILNEQIPKNILQPLVENALIHGLTDDKGEPIKGNIDIKIAKQNNRLRIDIIDSGKGISLEKINMLNDLEPTSHKDERGKHIGIQNIKERLKYLYGNDDCIIFHNIATGGTHVIVYLNQDFL